MIDEYIAARDAHHAAIVVAADSHAALNQARLDFEAKREEANALAKEEARLRRALVEAERKLIDAKGPAEELAALEDALGSYSAQREKLSFDAAMAKARGETP